MNDAQTLQSVLVKASEGTRKDGFTIGSVTITTNQANDTVSFSGTFPVSITTDPVTGAMVIAAQDWLTFAA